MKKSEKKNERYIKEQRFAPVCTCSVCKFGTRNIEREGEQATKQTRDKTSEIGRGRESRTDSEDRKGLIVRWIFSYFSHLKHQVKMIQSQTTYKYTYTWREEPVARFQLE